MRFLSYNIRNSFFREEEHSDALNNWRFRREAVAGLIKKVNPDILALQEDSEEQRTYLLAALRHDYALHCDDRLYEGEFVSVFVRRSIGIRSGGAFWVGGTAKTRGRIEGSIYARHATYLEIELGGAPLLVVNTHLDHSKDPKVKEREAAAFSNQLSHIARKAKSMIVLGDLNFAPGTPAYGVFKAAGFMDAGELLGNTGPTHPRWLMHPKEERIDYVWLTPDLKGKLEKYEILKDTYEREDGSLLEPSDHYPILANFSF